MGEWERQMQADRLAVVQQARKLVAESDSPQRDCSDARRRLSER